jgi:hypothetical protein
MRARGAAWRVGLWHGVAALEPLDTLSGAGALACSLLPPAAAPPFAPTADGDGDGAGDAELFSGSSGELLSSWLKGLNIVNGW